MAVQVPAMIRLENAMKTPIYIWCDEIGRIIDEYGVKELQNVLPVIIDSLFELNTQAGWSLRTLTKMGHHRDYDSICHLLSPRGPLMTLCYKLLVDSSVKYEFPLSCVPAATRHLLEEGVVPSFYVGKLQYHPQLRVPSCLVLNSFEFYMMHFLYYLVNPNLQKYSLSSVGSDSVYFAVLEEYLQYFLPCNGFGPEMIPAPSASSHYGSLVLATPPKQRQEVSKPAASSSLFKKSSVTPSTGSGSSSFSTERCSQHDSWRTMTLLQAISELWLSHVTTKENSNLQSGSSPHSPINLLQTIVFLPTLDHLRAVRMMVKHLHYFTNSMGPNIISGLDELKRTVWTYFQKKLYIFLRHTLEHWPLDASFRLFLETWLSYIQPWRYITTAGKSSDGEKFVENRWQTFIAENLLFYTLFLQKVIQRFLRVELSSNKTSLMLYRISKVYSQKNLKEMMKTAENSLDDGVSASKSTGSSQMAIAVRQFVNELENPSFSFLPLFSQETISNILALLRAAAQAKTDLRSLQAESTAQKVAAAGFLEQLRQWFTVPSLLGNEENGDELKKTIGYLENASDQLAVLFDVEVPVEPERSSSTAANANTSPSRTVVGDLSESSVSHLGVPLSPVRRYDLTYRGNPDTKPICSYEVTFLVRMLHQISSNINEKFGAELEKSYNRSDFTGKVFRQVLTPPVTYQEVVKKYGTPEVVVKHLPARVSLRFLAHQQVLGYIFGLFMLFYTFGWAPEILLLLLSCCVCAVVFVRASLETWRQSQNSAEHVDSFAQRY